MQSLWHSRLLIETIENNMIESLVKHFQLFHSVLQPSSFTCSAAVMSPKEVLNHFMSVETRVIFLCMLAVATGCKNVEDLKEKRRDKKYSIPNSILAIGMATDLIVRAVNQNEVGPAVQCMS